MRCASIGLWTAVLLLTCPARATPIPVANAGFEQAQLALCEFNFEIPGWSEIGCGTWRPSVLGQCIHDGYPAGIPEGVHIGYSNSGAATQTLGATLQPGTHYTLRVEVGRRADCCTMVSYAVRLQAGGVVLAEDPGLLDPAPGTFLTSTVHYLSPSSHPALGQPLQIELVGSGGQTNFDVVRLDTGLQPADLSGDGHVNGVDLAILLGQWTGAIAYAPCPPHRPADLNQDCKVNGLDLAVLLGAWS